jgi:beta-glucosidase
MLIYEDTMEKIDTLISQMTLEEKAVLCTGASAWTTAAFERLGIPAIFVADGPHGVRRVPNENDLLQKSLPATCFPTASCLASSWNADLLQRMGQAMAEEALAQGVDVLLGPGINIKRTPLNGRNFEYFSEDPFLSGEMGIALINGIQSRGVGTSLKHYAVNNQEFQRLRINAVVDERALREIYLYGFERAVKAAKPWTVMCAYNKVNGEYCSEHHRLLVEILKEEWGYEGCVVSDWGAVHDRVKSLLGGLDLEMPGPQPRRVEAVIRAVQSGECSMDCLDESVHRILRLVFKAQKPAHEDDFDVDEHHQLAREIAAEGMVLLKNDGILPLKNPQKVAVIGQSAVRPYFQGGGSSHINPTRVDIPLEELKKYAEDAEWLFAEGYPQKDVFDQAMIDEAAALAEAAEAALLFIALPPSKESEGYDRPDLALTDQQAALIQAVTAVQPRSVVILNSGSAVTMQSWVSEAGAVLQAWMMGQAGGGAIADIVFGAVNPSGKLAETFPLTLEDTPAFINFPGEAGEVRYGEGMYVGYRYYEKKQIPVQFPFGFGLSYTTFAYSNPSAAAQFRDVDGLTVSVDITNTGDTAGQEIVQVYVHDQASTLSRPEKELKGLAKVHLEAGETRRVTIPLDFRAFAFYHPQYQTWITEDGDFDILIGASSQDIRYSLTSRLTSTLELPSLLDEESTIREWLDDPRGAPVLAPVMAAFQEDVQEALGGEDSAGISIGDMLLDMPLRSVLMFRPEAFPVPVEELVADLLKQVHAQN